MKIARLQARLADLDLVYQGIVAPHIVAAHGTEDSSESAKSFVPLGSSKRRSRKQQRGSKVAQMANTAEPMVLTLTLEEEAEKQLRLKDIRATKASLEYILANYLRIQKWIAQCVRANCRRLSLIKERFLDTTSRLAWLAREHAMVSRVLFHIDYRLQRGAISSELLMPMEWLTAHRAFTCDVLNALDAQHESLLLEEISKLKADSDNLSDQDRILQGMQESIHLDIQYTAEKIYLDKALLRVVKGSDESVLLSDRAYHIKKKQLQLISHVIDALSLALHERFNAEDDATMFIAAFPSDDPSLGVESMLPTISAVLHEKFQPPVNFHVIQFMRVYLVQPWLSHQAVADVRIEDEVVSLEIRLESDQTEYGLLGEKIVSMEEGIKLIDEQILELNV